MAAKLSLPRWKNRILNTDSLCDACDDAIKLSLNCMMLGETNQANRIVDYLYKHDMLAFTTRRRGQGECMHTSWKASGCWPKIYDNAMDRVLSKKDETTIDGPTLFPKANHKNAKIDLFTKLRKPYGSAFVLDDFAKVRKWAAEGSEEAIPWSLEISLALNLGDVAGEVIRGALIKALAEHSCTSYVTTVLSSPAMWNFLKDGWLRKDLGLTRHQIQRDVDNFLEQFEIRLTTGRAAALRQKSIKELCELFNQACLQKRRLGNTGASRRFQSATDDPLPSTFLKPPATEAEIDALQRKVKDQGFPQGLPEDYIAFLRITNGVYYRDDKSDGWNIFFPVESITFAPFYLPDQLIPHRMLPSSFRQRLGNDIDWPKGEEKCINLGRGGDEGDQMYLAPSRIEKALEHFEKVYQQVDEVERGRLERVVRDVYGSVERFRSIESVILRCFHWLPEVEVFDSFTTLLALTVASMYTDDGDGDNSDDDDGDENDGEQPTHNADENGNQRHNEADSCKDGDENNETVTTGIRSPAEMVKNRYSTGQDDSSKRPKP